jgi:hypothetical protein
LQFKAPSPFSFYACPEHCPGIQALGMWYKGNTYSLSSELWAKTIKTNKQKATGKWSGKGRGEEWTVQGAVLWE